MIAGQIQEISPRCEEMADTPEGVFWAICDGSAGRAPPSTDASGHAGAGPCSSVPVPFGVFMLTQVSFGTSFHAFR